MKRIGLCFKLVPHKLHASKLYIPSQDVGYATFRNMDRKQGDESSGRKQYKLEENNINVKYS